MIGCLILSFALCHPQPYYSYPAYYPVAPQQPVYYAAPVQPYYGPVYAPAPSYPVVVRIGGGHRGWR